jgi:hypothetical protein
VDDDPNDPPTRTLLTPLWVLMTGAPRASTAGLRSANPPLTEPHSSDLRADAHRRRFLMKRREDWTRASHEIASTFDYAPDPLWFAPTPRLKRFLDQRKGEGSSVHDDAQWRPAIQIRKTARDIDVRRTPRSQRDFTRLRHAR